MGFIQKRDFQNFENYMTVHFFTGKDIDSATARYRGFLVVDELKKREVDVRLHEPLPLRS